MDAKLYTYGGNQPIAAIESLSATSLRNIIGEMELDPALTSRDVINGKVTAIRLQVLELGAPDASGRRSPVGTGKFFTVPCDLVISAVGEQVDDALMSANGIELDKKGRPAFKTNVAGVYAAGDATRGPATVVEGIADASLFAEIVVGHPHIYDIPA